MSTQPTPPPGYEIIPDEDLRTKPLPVGYIVSDRDPNDLLWLDGHRAGKMVTEESIAHLTYARPLPANQKPEWQPIATAPKDGTVFEAIYQDGTTDEICWALERVHPGGSSREAACGEGWATMNEGCRYAPVDEPTYWRPLYEWHNPSNLTDEEVGVKDGWRLCLKTETEHEGCEWFSHEYRKWRGICIYEGHPLSSLITYRTRRPLPESTTEPKEGGETCAQKESKQQKSSEKSPLPNSEILRSNPGASNAAAGTSNPDQQAANVQLPWLEQQQSDREALAAETDQAPPQEPTTPAVAEQELLPCPFCGTEPIHVRTTDECKCRTSLCPASYMLVSRERWNRRPAAPVADGETPAVCQICGFPNRSAYGATIECGCKKPSSTGETPETDALLENLRTLIADRGRPCGPADLERVGNHARNLERQLAAARRERDEARKIVRETSWMARRYADGRMTHAANTFNTAIEPAYSAGWLSPMPSNEAYARDGNFSGEWLSIEQQRDALTAERDRLREENKTLKETRQRTVEELVKTRPYLTLMSECNNLKSALATAQADIAKLCSVIAAAFAETAKPLNASVEYDATPTEGERLKKVQEILASAIDAADHGARDYQAAQAEAAEIERRYKWLLENIHRAQFGTGAGYDMEKGRVSLILNWIEFVKARPWDSRTNAPERIDAAVRAALDAASATEGGQP